VRAKCVAVLFSLHRTSHFSTQQALRGDGGRERKRHLFSEKVFLDNCSVLPNPANCRFLC
jgi:hypothetical protein